MKELPCWVRSQVLLEMTLIQARLLLVLDIHQGWLDAINNGISVEELEKHHKQQNLSRGDGKLNPYDSGLYAVTQLETATPQDLSIVMSRTDQECTSPHLQLRDISDVDNCHSSLCCAVDNPYVVDPCAHVQVACGMYSCAHWSSVQQ